MKGKGGGGEEYSPIIDWSAPLLAPISQSVCHSGKALGYVMFPAKTETNFNPPTRATSMGIVWTCLILLAGRPKVYSDSLSKSIKCCVEEDANTTPLAIRSRRTCIIG
jgi:hypothetical protein